jgi:putative Ca2+/H+ antiporter (TMEM165/GDT1 family)
MDLKLFATVFASVFVAELGDKTQLATVLFASEGHHPKLTVFLGAASALVATSAIGVLAGALISDSLNERVLHWAAGLGFIAIGAWVLWRS